MGSANYVDDPSEVRVTYRYKNSLDAEVFNEHFINVLKEGIYQKDSPLVEIVSNTEITVNKFVALIKNENVSVIDSVTQATVVKDILTKIDTRVSKNITGIDYTAPYIVVEFLYSQSQTITPTVKNVAFDDINYDTQIVLAKCLYRDDVGTKDKLYDIEETRTIEKSPMFEVEDWFDQFIGVVSGSVNVTVNGGLLEGTEISSQTFTYGSQTGEIPLPTAGYHRFDFVYVDDTNTLVLIQGQEEVDSGEDEYPLPDKRNIALYSFPVCYIYVTSNHDGVTRKFEPADIVNIIPRFMRKSQVASGSLSDIIITNQVDFEAYFGSSTLSDQGGTTPGKYDDGFVCEYNNGVKSVFVPGKRIAIKNQFDEFGVAVPYLLYTKAVILSKAEIDCAENVTIKLSNTFAGFVTHDNSNLIVDSYTGTNIKVKAENSLANNENYSDYTDQIVIAPSDEIFLFSKTPSINKKYTVSDIVKNIRPTVDVGDITSLITGSDFDTCKYGSNKIIHAWVDSNLYVGTIFFQIYTYNSTTNLYEAGSIYSDTDVATYSNVKVACFGDMLFIVSYNATRLTYCTVDLTTPANFSLTDVDGANSNSYNYPELYLTSSTEVAIVARNTSTSTLKMFKGTYSGSWSWANTNVDTSVVATTIKKQYSIVKYGVNYYISYCKHDGSNNCLYLAKGTIAGLTPTKLTSGTDQGNSSTLIISGDTNPLYVAYNFNTAKDTIKFAEIEIATPALSNIVTVITESGSTMTYVDLGLNTSNAFPTATNLIQVFGVNTGTGDSYYFSTSTDKTNWSQTSVDLGDNDTIAKISDIKENYVFVAGYNSDATTGTFAYINTLIRHHYVLDITVADTISPLGLTDLEVSSNYVENVLFDAYIDADNYGSETGSVECGLNLSNCIESNFKANIVNGGYTSIISGVYNGNDGKTFNLVLKMVIDESNSSTNNFYKINHSLIIESEIVENTYNLTDCTNTGLIGLVNKSMIAGGLSVTEVTTSVNPIENNKAYIANSVGQLTFSLPTNAPVGFRFAIIGKGAGGWKITQSTASQQIVSSKPNSNGKDETAIGLAGSMKSVHYLACCEIVCTTVNDLFEVIQRNGTISFTDNWFGDGSLGDATVTGGGTVNLSTVTGEAPNPSDGDAVVSNFANLTVDAGTTFTLDNPSKAWFLYIQGDLTLNGTISMTAKGATGEPGAGDGNNVKIVRIVSGETDTQATHNVDNIYGTAAGDSEAHQPAISGNGKIYTIGRYGGAGGAGLTTGGTTGTSGVASNSCGGGGGGGGVPGYNNPGDGYRGSAWGGGNGAGGGSKSNPASPGAPYAGSATAGGTGFWISGSYPNSGGAGGGAGNTYGLADGANGGTPGTNGQFGKGGVLVIIVGGNLIGAGNIVCNGSNGGGGGNGAGGYGGGGGGSGGGRVIFLCRSQDPTGVYTIQVNGGTNNNGGYQCNGGYGGAGSITLDQID